MYKVIVVEDEARIRKGFIKLIDWEIHGFEIVAEAKNGLEGKSKILQFKPDLVITDVKMPKMDGITMLEKCDYLDFKSVIISSYDDYELLRDSIRLKVSDYLLKPILKKDLIKILEEIKLKLDTKNFDIKDKHSILTIPLEFKHRISQEAFRIIKLNYSADLTAEKVAEKLNVSIPTLNKYVNEDFNVSFHKLLNIYRLERARQMIKNNTLLNYEIAERTGFSSYKYFSKTFKDYFGMSISEYRKDILKQL